MSMYIDTPMTSCPYIEIQETWICRRFSLLMRRHGSSSCWLICAEIPKHMQKTTCCILIFKFPVFNPGFLPAMHP